MINELPSLRETVEQYGLMAKKSLGQNFLLDMNITDKIIRCSLEAQNKADFQNEYLYEIGPGPGGLTRAILKANPQRLTVIEMDSRCIEILSAKDCKLSREMLCNMILPLPKERLKTLSAICRIISPCRYC